MWFLFNSCKLRNKSVCSWDIDLCFLSLYSSRSLTPATILRQKFGRSTCFLGKRINRFDSRIQIFLCNLLVLVLYKETMKNYIKTLYWHTFTSNINILQTYLATFGIPNTIYKFFITYLQTHRYATFITLPNTNLFCTCLTL